MHRFKITVTIENVSDKSDPVSMPVKGVIGEEGIETHVALRLGESFQREFVGETPNDAIRAREIKVLVY